MPIDVEDTQRQRQGPMSPRQLVRNRILYKRDNNHDKASDSCIAGLLLLEPPAQIQCVCTDGFGFGKVMDDEHAVASIHHHSNTALC